jgi:hypothetical protein
MAAPEPDHQKAESDIEPEDHQTQSRAGKAGEEGSYVGRTFNDDVFDAGESGAEARAQQK